METTENKGFVYEFGRFVVDPREKTLFIDGLPAHLPAKEFETLLLLVSHNGQALAKDEMMAALWRDSFVEESNLAKQISRLRKVLNTNGEEYIETLPKHGYRFSAEIRRVEHADDGALIIEKRTIKRVSYAVEDTGEPSAKALPPAKPFFMRSRIAIAGLILIVIGLSVFLWDRSRHAISRIDTIAIIPLRPLSSDEDTKTLGLGLTDALITKLGSLKPLVVRPANSVAQFAGSARDPVEIGRDLNVGAVLDGTIMQADGKLRVNIRLLDTRTGQQLWEDKFDGTFTGIFDLEDRISEKAARNLVPTIAGIDRRLTKRYTDDPEAFNAYLKGRYFWNKRSEEGFRRAIDYFNQAVAKDPNYALAYAGLGDCYILLGVWGTVPPNEAFPKAREAADKALAADGDLAEAVVSLAFVEWVYSWNFERAGLDFRRAIDLNPNYALAHHWYAYFLVSMKQNEEAIAEIKKAQELEGPVSLSVNTDIGEIYSWAGRYDEAELYLRDVLKIEPNYAEAHSVLGINLLKQDRVNEAISELESARALESAPRILSVLGYAYAVAEEKGKARKLIDELNDLAKRRYVAPFSVAVIYIGLSETDTAIADLESSYRERSDTMAILQVYPLLDGLRSDPRFADLEKRVGYR